MTYAPAVYTGNGVTTDFAIPFNYLDGADVDVFVAGVLTAFTFTSASIAKVLPAPAAATTVKITRSTASATRNVIFPTATSLTALQLNKSADQLFYLAEEAVQVANEALHLNGLDVYDVGGKKLVNMATPVNANDGATKGFIDTKFASDITAVAGYVAAAAVSASNASTSASTATTKASEANTSKLAADADAVATAADRVQTGLDRAAVAADKAAVITQKGLVDTAKTAVDTQKVLVDTAKAAVDVAKTAVDSQKALVDTAKGLVDTTKAATDTNVGLTAADRVQTGLDRTAAAASAAAAAASAGSLTAVEVQINAATDTAFADADMVPARKADGTLIKRSWANVKLLLNTYFQGLGGLALSAGDLLYASGVGSLARLAKGANGTVLTLVAGLPSWAAASSGGETLLTTLTPGAVTTIAYTSIPAGYNDLKIVFRGVSSNGVGGLQMKLSDNNGSTYSTAVTLGDGAQPAAEFMQGYTSIVDYLAPQAFKVGRVESSSSTKTLGQQWTAAIAAVNAIQFLWSAGNTFDGGSILVYGAK